MQFANSVTFIMAVYRAKLFYNNTTCDKSKVIVIVRWSLYPEFLFVFEGFEKCYFHLCPTITKYIGNASTKCIIIILVTCFQISTNVEETLVSTMESVQTLQDTSVVTVLELVTREQCVKQVKYMKLS